MRNKVYAIILAGGTGQRLSSELPKQFLKISGRYIIEHTMDAFEKHPLIDKIIIVINPGFRDLINSVIENNSYSKVIAVKDGGNTRQESSYVGISTINEDDCDVLIHDAVRPFVSEKIINDCIKTLGKYKAVDVAIPTADTIIQVDKNNFIEAIPDREYLRRGQTPQAFKLKIIKKAHELYSRDRKIDVTDDCGLVSYFKLAKIYVIPGSEDNIKITYPVDVVLADKLLQIRSTNLQNSKSRFKELKKSVIVVFGGYSGIGKSIFDLAKKHGAKAYRYSRKNGVDIKKSSEIKKALKEVYQKERRIDHVINTSGLLRISTLETKGQKEITEEIDVNFLGSVNVTKASIPYLKESSGSITLFTSSSYTRGRGMYSIYSSTKAAIVNFAQSVAEEIKDSNVNINVINPERTNTPMRKKNFGNEPPDSLLNPDMVAEATLNTILKDITGQVIEVKKGYDRI